MDLLGTTPFLMMELSPPSSSEHAFDGQGSQRPEPSDDKGKGKGKESVPSPSRPRSVTRKIWAAIPLPEAADALSTSDNDLAAIIARAQEADKIRDENAALAQQLSAKENEALRSQLDRLRAENAALRKENDGLKDQDKKQRFEILDFRSRIDTLAAKDGPVQSLLAGQEERVLAQVAESKKGVAYEVRRTREEWQSALLKGIQDAVARIEDRLQEGDGRGQPSVRSGHKRAAEGAGAKEAVNPAQKKQRREPRDPA
ncbi:unnamed protein product [Peniophora sp. CBMAI 1063]|nr:unnamed protein product [Peniophora sp. CBMAI 1063]